METDDTTLQLRADLGSSTGTRVLNAISALTPRAVLRTSIGQRLSNLSLKTVMDSNGLKIVGITESQEPYRFEADPLWAVRDASATVNGEDLGECWPPDRPIDFGDAKTPDEPFVAASDVHLRPPPE